jgi:hypothetical protein
MSGNAGKDAVHAFIDAFNNLDSTAMADAFNFPHIRLASGKFAVFETREDFMRRFDANTSALAAEGWHHTVIESLEVIHAAPDKVHLAIAYTRRHADDTVYSQFNSLWIATRQEGHWGIQFRSSCMPPDLAQTMTDGVA